jgi:hypothetical protein
MAFIYQKVAISRLIVFSLAVVLTVGIKDALAQQRVKFEKVTTNNSYRAFLINSVFNHYGNNGDGSYNSPGNPASGFEFPIGSGKFLCFEDGVVWGGLHKGRTTPTVGGSTYRHGLQAGKILYDGTLSTPPIADDPSLTRYRVYRVRPDVNPTSPLDSVAGIIEAERLLISRYENQTAQQIYDQYVADWNEWPASEGAPYRDVDSNGIYNPAVDIPGRPGSGQTLWYVANDMDSTRTKYFAASPSIGLEMQKTVWGYNLSGAIGNTIFISTLLINKSGAPIDSMFLVQWADPDIGDWGDDFAGCDLERNLGYAYNSSHTDTDYGTQVPAGGFSLLQGPIVTSPGDSAIFKRRFRQGFKNLPMSAFVFFVNGSSLYVDPAQGANGDVEWYKVMKGLSAQSGAEYIDPITGLPTKFTLSGDPVTGTGWIDGTHGLIPGDRRICMVTGPFTMAPGDTQELVVAHLAGMGSDRLSSLSMLRFYADLVATAFRAEATGPVSVADEDRLPTGFTLEQNYPNPFNPSTTIRYTLPHKSAIQLAIFNTLGQEVAQLVNEEKEAGYHEVKFDGTGLSSGVYFYRIQDGSFTQTRKLLLLR